MSWTVEFTGKAKKQTDKLPTKIREVLYLLVQEIGSTGPVRGDFGQTIQSCPEIGTIAI